MLILRGAEALSTARKGKFLQRLRHTGVSIESIDAYFVYFVEFSGSLESPDRQRLCEILEAIDEMPGFFGGEHLLVVPRLGTISPWSSKATDILGHCGLSQVERVERGLVYHFTGQQPVQSTLLADSLHDRMTESVLSDFKSAEQLFSHHQPRPMRQLSVLQGGVQALAEVDRELGLALAPDEMEYLVDAYRDLDREPTDVELMMFAQANSEHCRHKIFNASWTIDGVEQARSLFAMIRNTHELGGQKVLSAYSDNAAVVEGPVTSRWMVQQRDHRYHFSDEPVHLLMKVETHNHPTAISPFAGAGTGSGGEIRDEGAVGQGSKPKAGLCGFTVSNLRIPEHVRSWEGEDYGKPGRMVTPYQIMIDGPIGAAAFNNEFGRPNLCGYFRTFEQNFDNRRRGYHKPIMIAGGYGNIRDQHVQKPAFEPGCKLVVLGGPAMLIGLGGGAASSMSSGSSSEDLDFASVQRQNPEMERRCQEVIDACWAMGDHNPIAFIHDVGAGGLSNALPELVKDGGTGGRFDLRAVPSAEPGMSPLEIWSNEAQERYVLSIRPEDLQTFEAICQRERAVYAVVGESIAEARLEVTDPLLKQNPVNLPMAVLFGKPPKMHRDVQSLVAPSQPLQLDLSAEQALAKVLQHPAVASKSFLITIGDRSITGMVVRDQMVGPWQVPVADQAVTTTGYKGFTGEVMSMGERTPLALLDAPASGRMAVAEAITNLAAVDIGEISNIKLSANWMCAAGAPGEDASLYRTVEAVGMEFCPALGLTIPVGKDSMSMRTTWEESGQNKEVTAPTSLIVSAFAPVRDVRLGVTPELTVADNAPLYLLDLGRGKNRLGGSILAQVNDQMGSEVADMDEPALLLAAFNLMQQALQQRLLQACHDRSDGGLMVTLAEMAFAARCGIEIELPGNGDPLAALFSEEVGLVVQLAPECEDAWQSLVKQAGLVEVCHRLGLARADENIRVRRDSDLLVDSTREALQKQWAETSYLMQRERDNPDCADEEYQSIALDDTRIQPILGFNPAEDVSAPFLNLQRPRVAVLREQGVNGQMEMAAAFHAAGFESVDLHMSDLIAGRTDLQSFHGLVACGGFSYGDVLGAGRGWSNSILQVEPVREIFSQWFEHEDRFTLGVCNGCQMVANLAPLIPGAESWPRFRRNRSEQFEARVSQVRVEPSDSVLLQGMAGSVLPVAVAHGEGRAEFSAASQLASAQQAGQIALRYVTGSHQVAQQYPANPNGSPDGITGLTAANGRVTIMMPHPERVYRTLTNSWHPGNWGDDGPWLRMFRNARVWVG